MMKNLTVGQVCIGAENPLALIAGPCVLENLEHALSLADSLQKIAMKVGVGLVFKASYDKANRTSVSSYRGPGLDQGLQLSFFLPQGSYATVVLDEVMKNKKNKTTK